MSRIIIVKNCLECPYRNSEDECIHNNSFRKITTLGIVSKWCSLPKEVILPPKPYRKERR
jgi:hypothetical protein